MFTIIQKFEQISIMLSVSNINDHQININYSDISSKQNQIVDKSPRICQTS